MQTMYEEHFMLRDFLTNEELINTLSYDT